MTRGQAAVALGERDVRARPRLRARWTLNDALALVRALWPVLETAGYHVGLTGGVLVRGASDKDVDLIVYPRSTARRDEMAARAALESVGMRLIVSVEDMHAAWRAGGGDDSKRVDVWAAGPPLPPGRVDVMWLA